MGIDHCLREFYIEQAREERRPRVGTRVRIGPLDDPNCPERALISLEPICPRRCFRARGRKAPPPVCGYHSCKRICAGSISETRFSAILIPGNSLLHLLTIEDLKQCFASVRRHLAPGGKLVFDVSKWDLPRLARDPGERHPVLRVTHPERGEISVEETAEYDAAEQVRRVVWYLSAPDDPDFQIVDYRLRVIFPQELVLLLDCAGFRLETRYGEFTREAFTSSSPRQVCVCLPVGE